MCSVSQSARNSSTESGNRTVRNRFHGVVPWQSTSATRADRTRGPRGTVDRRNARHSTRLACEVARLQPRTIPRIVRDARTDTLSDRFHIMLDQVSAGLRLADLLDIGVIAVLLYFGLKWFRRRESRSLAVGIGVWAVLYLAASRLEMVLTSMLFQIGFTAVLLSLIVVFQHDIRRAFERLSSRSLLPNKRPPGSETPELRRAERVHRSAGATPHRRCSYFRDASRSNGM